MAGNVSAQFVRGGQTTQHWWRMGLQVFKFGSIVAAFLFTLTYCVLIARNYELPKVQMAYTWWLANFQTEQKGNGSMPMRSIRDDGTWYDTTALAIRNDPRHRNIYLTYEANAKRFAYWSIGPGLVGFAITLLIFWRTGQSLSKDQHIRGSRLVDRKELARWSKLKWREHEKTFGKSVRQEQRYTIAGIPFPPNTVQAQTGIFGTTGVGKTTALKELITNIRENDGRAMVFDRMGGMVSEFYDPETDIIINPFDARSHVWTPFAEASDAAGFAQIAEVMIPVRADDKDPFWAGASRLVFEYAARQLMASGKRSNEDLRRAIMEIPADKLEELIKGTPGQHFFGKNVEKTSASIRANMIQALRFLEFLRDDGKDFSARDWITKEDGPGIVFLTTDSEHEAASRNIISTIIEVAANALMTLPEAREPRVWFIIDELPSLNSMPFMVKKIAQVRQFGGAFVLGYQVYSQLEEVYGEKGAQSISGNLNNRIVFNTPDARTAKLFSDSLGSEDLVEIRQNVTVGAHVARDGQGMTENRTERPIITASQIQALPQFELCLRFAYDAPTTRCRIAPSKADGPGVPALVPYRGPGFGLGDLDVGKEDRSDEFVSLSPERQLAEFNTYFDRMANYGMSDVKEGFTAQYDESDRMILWLHYATERIRGVEPHRIDKPMPEGLIGQDPSKALPLKHPVPPYPLTVIEARDAEQVVDADGQGAPDAKAKDGASKTKRAVGQASEPTSQISPDPLASTETQADLDPKPAQRHLAVVAPPRPSWAVMQDALDGEV
ncbi:MAG: type IV secretion system DNA-binding domain-containing protein [Pseudomonadota bacterium]